jgi:hypothetical protein
MTLMGAILTRRFTPGMSALPTLLSRSEWRRSMAGVGHEDQFMPPRLSACSGKQTIAAAPAMGEMRRFRTFV